MREYSCSLENIPPAPNLEAPTTPAPEPSFPDDWPLTPTCELCPMTPYELIFSFAAVPDIPVTPIENVFSERLLPYITEDPFEGGVISLNGSFIFSFTEMVPTWLAYSCITGA